MQERYQASLDTYGDIGSTENTSVQAIEQRDMLSRMDELKNKLTNMDSKLNSLVEQANEQESGSNPLAQLHGVTPGETKKTYTRDNFAGKFGQKVQQLNKQADSDYKSLVSYCERHGFGINDFEQYINQQNKLNGELYGAKQELITMLRQEGELDGGEVDVRI